MAQHLANDIAYYLSVALSHKDTLGGIRHWAQLKIGYEEERIWIKDLSFAQMDALEVKSLAQKDLYYARDQKLFPMGSLLPERNIPSLLWTPIERGLPLQLPALNHNYFGISETIAIELSISHVEQEAFALVTPLATLQDYIRMAPEIRLKNLDWVILDKEKALLMRTPLLPIQGQVFWRKGNSLIPSGYDFVQYSLHNALENVINREDDQWIVWNADGSYFPIPKRYVEALSLSSFKQSMNSLHHA
jgi:hypothetical protein